LWFSPGTPVSSINKTYRHDISEILLKVALNSIKQTNKPEKKILKLLRRNQTDVNFNVVFLYSQE
jgi:hypothetical protein